MFDKTPFNNYSLTVIQIMYMSHALGIDNGMLGRQRYKPYRNYYSCAKADKQWEDLVHKGLAEVEDSDKRGVMYRVSHEGRNILGRIFQMRIEEEEE